MVIFFEVIKGIFFFLSVLVWLVVLRWDILFSVSVFEMIKLILIPWYLIFCGLMIGYLGVYVFGINHDEISHKFYVRSFVVGLLIGFIFAVLYVLL